MFDNIARKDYNIVNIIFIELTIKSKKFVYFISNVQY
jgi:hypothetical protein